MAPEHLPDQDNTTCRPCRRTANIMPEQRKLNIHDQYGNGF
jgi:hypothetical protein